MKVVCFGDLNLDFYTSEPLESVATLTEKDFRKLLFSIGGHGANQAVAAALFGAPTYFVGRVGNDFAGQLGRTVLQEEGLNIDYVTVDPCEKTGIVVIDPERPSAPIILPGTNCVRSSSLNCYQKGNY